MDDSRIASLLAPFVPEPGLTPLQTKQVRTHLELLLKWNEKTNLTSVRTPEEIISRHFGESFFLAAALAQMQSSSRDSEYQFLDVGSGAGFPGIPFKIYLSHLRGRLVESQNKKATFLKEVIRTLNLTNISVFTGRAEELAQSASGQADLVSLRGVERFESVLPVAARLVAPNGWLALLIGSAQVESSRGLLSSFTWEAPRPLPQSQARVLLIGKRNF